MRFELVMGGGGGVDFMYLKCKYNRVKKLKEIFEKYCL